MSSKRGPAREGMPLEYVYKRLEMSTTDTEVVTHLDLDLMQDEVAEIHKIDAEFSLKPFTHSSATFIVADFLGILSLNPNISAEGDVDSHLEDLETFFNHRERMLAHALTDVGFDYQMTTGRKISDFVKKPILVGTNVGMKCSIILTGLTEKDAEWGVRLYFTRRRASIQELNQILLKRR